MVTSRLQKRMMFHKKLFIIRALTKSKSTKRSSIIVDAFLYIYKLKVQIEALKREYHYLINNVQEVKIERVELGVSVKVTCKKRLDLLASILEAFEEKNLNVVQAKITYKHLFNMEAIVQNENKQEAMDVEELREAVALAVRRQNYPKSLAEEKYNISKEF